ncbi:MAG: hypothetical protein ABR529_03580 [Actinomycetota bacterium]
MNAREVETELRRRRGASTALAPGEAPRLSIAEALAFRDAGNVPDEEGRTLRLVLHVESSPGAAERRRLLFEPDFHDEPRWRRPGSVPINVLPLTTSAPSEPPRAWFEDPEMAALENEWRATGAVAGALVPSEWRGFVLKTIVALRAAGKVVTPDTIAASVARWLPPAEAELLRAALVEANASTS